MHAYGTDTTRRMYFTEYPITAKAEVSFCVAIPPESEGEFVEWTESMPALCIYHHGAYEEMYDADLAGRESQDGAGAGNRYSSNMFPICPIGVPILVGKRISTTAQAHL